MSIAIFGQGDRLAIPVSGATFGHVLPGCAYTNRSFGSCYSQYGFAYPLDSTGLPLKVLLSAELPKTTDFIVGDLACRYLLIDFTGVIWEITFHWSDEGVKGFKHIFVDHTSSGWWIPHATDMDIGALTDLGTLLGFLFTNPSVKKINQYWAKYVGSSTLNWLSIKDIVEKLNTEYLPKEIKK